MRVDVLIIGGGVVGCAIARALSGREAVVALAEAREDVAMGASRANSAIVHAGYDAPPGTLMARLGVRGNALYGRWCEELQVPLQRTGSLVIAFDADDERTLLELYGKGNANGVPGLEIVSGARAREIEPSLSPEVTRALYAETGAITCPYEMTIACFENARANGLTALMDAPVTAIERAGGGFRAQCGARSVQARYIVNAAGLFADDIALMAGDGSFAIRPRKGEYMLLDRSAANVRTVIFQTPSRMGKGVLVSPTVDGNMFAGPTARDQDSRTDVDVTGEGVAELMALSKKSVPSINFRAVITAFAGLRAQASTGDFVLRAHGRMLHAAGICSPGLTAAPAIAEYALELLEQMGLSLPVKKKYNPRRPHIARFAAMARGERAAAIAADPRYGRVICRCETVTEAEIVEAIRRGARSLDAVKRRTRAGMGRCQGGFCSPRVMEILCRETGMRMTGVTKFGGGSVVAPVATREGDSPAFGYSKEQQISPRQAGVQGDHPPGGGLGAEPPASPMRLSYDVAIIGGGPAGLAAALAARGKGARVLVLERDAEAGGILRQCIHNGFGLHYFKEELTGPEYAGRFVRKVAEAGGIELLCDTMVLEFSADRRVLAVSAKHGLIDIDAGAIVLAMGCRERTRGALNIPGSRPSGIFTAGCAQRLCNMEGILPGREVVILGSGDIGLIMARRMTWEGANVRLVAELMPYSSGLNRNIVQCLEDNGIPLLLSHTVTRIHGDERLTAVTVARVDDATKRPVPGTGRVVPCDTLLLSVGLLPENELSKDAGVPLDDATGGAAVDERRETSLPGVFACGNVLHVHDLVDHVSVEAEIAGAAAAEYALSGGGSMAGTRRALPAGHVRYIVPQRIRTDAAGPVDFYFRVGQTVRPARLTVTAGGQTLVSRTKRLMAPGEMETVSIDMTGVAGDIQISVEEA